MIATPAIATKALISRRAKIDTMAGTKVAPSIAAPGPKINALRETMSDSPHWYRRLMRPHANSR